MGPGQKRQEKYSVAIKKQPKKIPADDKLRTSLYGDATKRGHNVTGLGCAEKKASDLRRDEVTCWHRAVRAARWGGKDL